jgi:Sigma-70 region 3
VRWLRSGSPNGPQEVFMPDPITEQRVLDALDTIFRETGYPPAAQELAAALGCSTKQVRSALASARELIRYPDDEPDERSC